jgi:hypothetical protein
MNLKTQTGNSWLLHIRGLWIIPCLKKEVGEWDALKREIFPKGKATIQKQKKAIQRV